MAKKVTNALPPCDIGDVFYYQWWGGIVRGKVVELSLKADRTWHITVAAADGYGVVATPADIGTKLFRTAKEAGHAMKEAT